MSAFVVGNDHIDGLLTFAIDRHVAYFWANARREITTETATEIGRVLLAENERSVSHRYNDPPTDEAATYRFRRWIDSALTAVSILKACDCFDYQACETDDYEQSHAAKIIDAIRGKAYRNMPGYDDAPGWELRRRKPDAKPAPALLTVVLPAKPRARSV